MSDIFDNYTGLFFAACDKRVRPSRLSISEFAESNALLERDGSKQLGFGQVVKCGRWLQRKTMALDCLLILGELSSLKGISISCCQIMKFLFDFICFSIIGIKPTHY